MALDEIQRLYFTSVELREGEKIGNNGQWSAGFALSRSDRSPVGGSFPLDGIEPVMAAPSPPGLVPAVGGHYVKRPNTNYKE